jgi:multiple sugar transport system substrate-binding protein
MSKPQTGTGRRRWFCVIAAASIAALLIAGCGGGNAGTDTSAAGGTDTSAAGAATGGDTSAMASTGGGSSVAASTGDSASSSDDGTWADTGKPVDIMGWSTGDEVGTSRVEFAKQQNPDLSIVADQNGFDQQKFATTMAGGAPPTGVSMDRQLLATYAAKGFLQPLDGCIAAQGIDMSQFYPEAVQESTWDGHVYGIPEFYTTRGLYVNLAALKDAGISEADVTTADWDGVRTLADKLYRAKGDKPDRIGFDPKLPEFLPLWAMAAGGSIVDDTGAPTLDSPAVVDALTWAVSLINDQGGWASFKSFRDTWDFFGADNEFAADQIGVMPYEQWYVNVLAGSGGKADFTVLPIKAKDGSDLTFETGSSLAIPTGSANAGGMCAAMKVLTSTDAWLAAGAAREQKIEKDGGAFTGIFSANKAANEAIRTKYVKPTGDSNLDTAIATFYDSLDAAKMIPSSPAGQEIQQDYQQAVTSALGGTDPAQALQQAQQAAMQAFQDATT